jgi:hypothetical protein
MKIYFIAWSTRGNVGLGAVYAVNKDKSVTGVPLSRD